MPIDLDQKFFGAKNRGWQGAAVRVHSVNNVPSQVRTIVVPETPGSVRGDFRRFWAVLFNFGRFQRRYAPKLRLRSGFLGWYVTLFEACTRTLIITSIRGSTSIPC